MVFGKKKGKLSSVISSEGVFSAVSTSKRESDKNASVGRGRKLKSPSMDIDEVRKLVDIDGDFEMEGMVDADIL